VKVEVTQENRKEIDGIIHRIVRAKYKNELFRRFPDRNPKL